MSKYLYNCHKCTNKAVSSDGSLYCLPMITGKKAVYILSGETGKDFVFACDEYQTEPRQFELYEAVKTIREV